MKRVRRNFSHQTTEANLLISGLVGHLDQLSKRGIDTNFVRRMSSALDRSIAANNDQHALKARMMERTAERQEYQAELDKLCREARKLIKIELPPETWREFGITDKR
jgi:hypothetical protein